MYRIRAKIGGIVIDQLTKDQVYFWFDDNLSPDNPISDFVVERFDTVRLEWISQPLVKFLVRCA